MSWRWVRPLPTKTVTLKNGRAKVDPKNSGSYLALTKVEPLNLTGGLEQQWLVTFHYGTGGSATWNYVYFIQFVDGKSKVLDVLESGSRGYGGIDRLAVSGQLLKLDFLDPGRTAGDCCSRGRIGITYKWSGSGFAELPPRGIFDSPGLE